MKENRGERRETEFAFDAEDNPVVLKTGKQLKTIIEKNQQQIRPSVRESILNNFNSVTTTGKCEFCDSNALKLENLQESLATVEERLRKMGNVLHEIARRLE